MSGHSSYSPLIQQAPVYIGSLLQADRVNPAILHQYEKVKDEPDIRKTHHFMGRFENTYIPENRIPQIRAILDMGLHYAEEILQMKAAELRLGFWFNEMHPGHQTTLHTHEEEDELLSAVYYIQADHNSGDLIVKHHQDDLHFTPVEGRMILFSPEVPHQVEVNESHRLRLSVALNFGRQTSAHE